MLDLAGLDLDEAGKDFLRRLGDAVVWVGKYPVSIDADRMQRLKRYSTSDLLLFKHLWNLFVRALQIVMQRPVARRPREDNG